MNNKIINTYIPSTYSHSKTRMSKIIKHIKNINNQKNSQKQRTGIKTLKRKYQQQTQQSKHQTKHHIQQPQQTHHEQPHHEQQIQTQLIIPDMEPINTPNQDNTLQLLDKSKLDKSKLDKSKLDKSKSHNYIIAIPSYNRPELIQVKTLALLHKHNIKPKHIHIFVSDRDQYNLYKSKVPAFLYHKLIIGVKGLKNQRNYINNYYREGYHIVEMDDDIDKIVELVIHNSTTDHKSQKSQKSQKHSASLLKTKKSSKKVSIKLFKPKQYKTLKPIENLDKFIKDAFKRCVLDGIFLWGVYPLANAHFMTNTITTDLRFIVGPMWGMINRHRPDLQLTIDEKENTERTLQNWVIDGKVLRFNNIGIDTKYYKNKGGMQNEGKNRKEEALKSVYYLHKLYPQLTKLNLGKKSGVPEIKLIKHK